ncbi:hypothetical protein VHEMI10234 [[Torrubiella] hemipterigena]|uniref:Uncharacterized protein n=1 Tax=[Torrubiella] hemipterigena TaxID=1531966 RepID=A0A0A1TRV0_9HYPO|nr:hypothetical protein VHEMI10234 [[Torrubiella] hemipterigena]
MIDRLRAVSKTNALWKTYGIENPPAIFVAALLFTGTPEEMVPRIWLNDEVSWQWHDLLRIFFEKPMRYDILDLQALKTKTLMKRLPISPEAVATEASGLLDINSPYYQLISWYHETWSPKRQYASEPTAGVLLLLWQFLSLATFPFSGTSNVDQSQRLLLYIQALRIWFSPEVARQLQNLLTPNEFNGIHAHLDYSWNILPLCKQMQACWRQAKFTLIWAGHEPQGDGLHTIKLQLQIFPVASPPLQQAAATNQDPKGKIFERPLDLESEEDINSLFPSTIKTFINGQIVRYPNVLEEEIENLRLMLDLAHRCITIWTMAGGVDPDELVDPGESRPRTPIFTTEDTDSDLDIYEDSLELDGPHFDEDINVPQ